ncbi:MAG: hypothetical protein DCC43_03510 [Candidatus Brocadia sp.]|nr:hypothetical protein [Candidatus Brocadia fulgida]MCE7911175.1 hypothetical protein [Candidatus Brocadia sp. AMX3]MDG5997259.1 hypothetical protein [Candidatus Brocadia sp.]RIK02298.1 MAG: hypothetical protein DCC43_03510 [Candidatus Brocadia sp.]
MKRDVRGYTTIKNFAKRLVFQSIQIKRDCIDFLTLFNIRDKRAQDSQGVIKSSLWTVCKVAVVNRVYGGMALLCSTSLLLLIIGGIGLSVLFRFPFGVAVFYTVSLIALCFIFFRALLLPLLSLLNREKIALLIEQKYPSLNNGLISSIQLSVDKSRRKKATGYSERLISMLIDDTAKQLKQLDLSQVISKRFFRLSCVMLVASALVFGVIGIMKPSYLHKNIPILLSYLRNGKALGESGFPGPPSPVIGDITMSYRFPLYSGLQPKTVYNTSGDIRALKGSEIQMSALSDQPLLSAAIIFNHTQRIPFLIENGRTIKGVLSLLESGTYVFETTDSKGRTVQDATPHTIQVDPDRFPEVTIHMPAKDLAVHEKDTVEIRYAAKDDFGIGEISLVYEQGEERKNRVLASFGKTQLQYSGAYAWSLSELTLQPDDKIAYYIEVKDNDAISGPKVSRSTTFYLEIYSSRKKHIELVQLQEALLQELIHMLADDLTKRIDDERYAVKEYLTMTQDGIQDRAEKIIGLFTDILVGMQDDVMANYSVYYSLENLKNNFRNVTEKKREAIRHAVLSSDATTIPISQLHELQKFQDEEVINVEDSIIFLHDLIRKQRLEEVLDTGKNLVQSQNTLEKLLEQLRKGEDAKLNEKVLAELKRIEETIRQMMEKLMQMAQGEHMDEFLNADALRQLEQKDVMKELDAMKEAFNKGNLDAALQSAQRFLSALQGMMNQMQSSAKNLADSSYDEMLKETNQFLDKISELENKERKLTENTNALKKDIQKRISEATEENLRSFFQKQGERVATIRKDIAEAKEMLAQNKLLQEYLQVNRELQRMSDGRNAMAGRFRELFGGNEEGEDYVEEFDAVTETAKKNAELNRAINKDPLQRDFLSMSRDLPQAEETLTHLEEMLNAWEVKESLGLAKELSNSVNQWNNRMKRTLEQKSVAGKEDISKKDREIPERVEDAARQNQHIIQDLEAMMERLEDQQLASMTPEDQDALRKYAKEQKELQEETDDLREMTGERSQQNPFMDEDADNQLDLASKSMEGAGKKLEKHDMQGALNDERESLYRLAEAKKGMEKAKERIARGMMGQGMPMPMPFRGQRDEGQFGASTEKVEIPSEEAYKVPKEFREDILNALKEGLPEKYQDLNKDYYQRLVD